MKNTTSSYLPTDKNTKLSIPFYRLSRQKERKPIEAAFAGNSVMPEVLFAVVGVLSFFRWGHNPNILLFAFWLLILGL